VAFWAAAAPIAGAVVAPARIKVELNRKTVQHQEGGIVREILVREGQHVQAGDPLLVVGDLRTDAELALHRDALRAALAARARATAEAALQPEVTIPPELQGPDAADHVGRERALFAARRRALDDQVASLREQVHQAQSQAAALQARIDAADDSTQYAASELQMNEQLVKDGFINRTRMLALQRNAADYRARLAEFRGELAAVRQRIGEMNAHAAQLRNQYQSQAADDLKEASTRVRETEQKLLPSRDQAERQLVRSPVAGEVMQPARGGRGRGDRAARAAAGRGARAGAAGGRGAGAAAGRGARAQGRRGGRSACSVTTPPRCAPCRRA
jgi:HlyD family secretion protein